MISEVETCKHRKYEVKIGNTIYYVLINCEIDDFCEFYITKKGNGIIMFEIGFNCPYDKVYDYIKDNIVDWVCDYENTVIKIEDDYE